MAAGNREARGNASALRSDRLFRDLDDDLFSLLKNRVDARRSGSSISASAVSPSPTAARFALGLTGFENALEIVADVEKGGLLQADVDKGRLHAGKNTADPALHYVADDTLVSLALDMEFGELAVLNERDTGFPAFRINHNFVAHRSACPAVRPVCLFSRLRRFVPPALASPIEGVFNVAKRTCRLATTADSASLESEAAGYAVWGATCFWALRPRATLRDA